MDWPGTPTQPQWPGTPAKQDTPQWPGTPATASSVTGMTGQAPAPGLIRRGAHAVVSGLESIGSHLGIPEEPIKNAKGDTVFPTNALERGLQSSASTTKEAAIQTMG